MKDLFRQAALALQGAKALLVTAGAGMGVGSGLPDFRGDQGFWKAYPPYRRLGISFVDAANPAHFERDPAFGWGFYGHRADLYRSTVPHDGFRVLLEWGKRLGLDTFVFTSNVDGQFQKAGFAEERVVEIHGSIHYLQCTSPCSQLIWENREEVPVDESTMRALHIPRCAGCGRVARPNILMFGDWSWIDARTRAQEQRLRDFLQEHAADPLVVIEMGAGTAIPTVRALGERVGLREGATVVRINPREPHILPPHISLPCGAVEGLSGIDRFLGE
ncbi:MAG TPA: Sir2 family NAD-dependent protein deacetylase [Verrucomicrobiae bacterium]|nr:Sir2 family NAD-dependent protein deacetylase [Verrucomicrobiae bacterium]